MNNIKGYLYSRVSSLKQVEDKDGLERQSEMVNTWLLKHPEVQLDTDFTFKDAGKSAYKGKMLEKGASLAKFLAAVQSGLIKTPCYLLIEHLDRITRLPPTDARKRIVIPLLEAGVSIVTVSDGLIYSLATVNNVDGTTPHVDLMLTMFLNMAYQYSKKLSDRVSSAKVKKRNAVIDAVASDKFLAPMGGMCPQYLRVVKDRDGQDVFIIDPVEGELVKRIFATRARGESINSIARQLNDEGVPVLSHHLDKKGKPKWSAATLSTLLKNPAVIGVLKESHHLDDKGLPKYPEVKGYYPPVIDFATWSKVQALSIQGKPPSKRTFAAATNIFRGYIDCKHCGKRMTVNGVRENFPGSITCRSTRVKLCDAPTFSMQKFETGVIEYLFKGLSKVESGGDNADVLLAQLRTDKQNYEAEIDNYRAIIKTTRIASIRDDYLRDMEEATMNLERCFKSIEHLLRQSQTQNKFTLDGLDFTKKEDREKARDIINEHIEKIILDTKDKKVDVYLYNGNAVVDFDLVNPVDNTVTLIRAHVPDAQMKEWASIAGTSKFVMTANKPEDKTITVQGKPQFNSDAWPDVEPEDEQP